MTGKKIFISAGEVSGDIYASMLANAIKEIDENAQIYGMGGSFSKRAGVNIVVDSEKNASVMGFKEILSKVGKIFESIKTIKLWLKNEKPDAVILIDFPDFNFRIAKYAYKLGIPVFYFIPPQIWAWREGRVNFLKKYITHSVVIYPFEENYYKSKGYENVSFLGHPFVYEYEEKLKLTDAEKQEKIVSWGLDPSKPIVSIFPGSRNHEIKNYLKLTLQVFNLCKEKIPTLQGVVAVSPTFSKEKFKEDLKDMKLDDVSFVEGDSVSVLQCSNAGLLKSGTNNVQACIIGLPFLMFYSAGKIVAFILSHFFLKVKNFSIVNLIKEGTIKEFLQEDLTAQNLSKELLKILEDKDYQSNMIRNLNSIKALFYRDKTTSLEDLNVAKKAIDLFYEKL